MTTQKGEKRFAYLPASIVIFLDHTGSAYQ